MNIIPKHLLYTSLLVIASASANATPITWTLSANAPTLIPAGFPFPFAPPILGTFTYDADTYQMSNWYIHQCLFDCNTLAHSPGPGETDFAEVENGATFLFFAPGLAGSPPFGMRLELTAPLTDAGGVIPLIPGLPNGGPGDVIGQGSAVWRVLAPGVPGTYYPITSGTVAAVPEPRSSWCIALVSLALIAAARHNR